MVEEVIPGIPVVSCTFTIPKMLRIYFRFDHSLYPELSRCAWETMKECFQAYRKKWAQWIQKVWGTDPLLCPKCGEKMNLDDYDIAS
ncbi:MAG: hypothetical protein AB2L14_11565 [Candidatus Xenobiia bacterium LiM19]